MTKQWTKFRRGVVMLAFFCVSVVNMELAVAGQTYEQEANPAPEQAAQTAQDVIRQTAEQIIAAIQEHKSELAENPDMINDLINQYLIPRFDFPLMSRWVLGRHWKNATEAQQQQFMQAFRHLLVRTYGTALAEYSDQKITYLPSSEQPDQKRISVQTLVEQSGSFPIPINYSMHRKAGKWMVYDVTVDGISLVLNYRSSFAASIRAGGLAGLIDSLQKQVSAESGKG